MALDPNIALQAGQGIAAPPNPLQQVGQVANVANAFANNRLIGTQTEQAQQSLAAIRLKTLGAIAGTALRAYDPQNPASAGGVVDALHLGIDSAVANGSIDKNTAQQLYQGIATTKSPEDLIGRVQQFALMGIDPNAALTRIYGAPNTQNTGGSLVSGVMRDPMMGGGFRPVTAMANTMSPGEAVQLQQVPVMVNGQPTGARETVTNAEIARRTGQAGPPGTPAAFPQGYSGRPAAPAGAAPVLAPQPSGSLGTTMAPGQQSSVEVAAADATKASGELYRAADAANGRRAQLNTMIADLAGLRSTGPGTEGQLRLEAFMQKYGGLGITLTADEVAKGEAFAKVARTLAQQQATALGAGSDARLMNALGANPNLDLSKRGNTEILAMLKGNEDAIIAKAQAWDKWLASGKTPDSYNQFQTDFNRRFDPRVFQWQNLYPSLSEAERQSYLAKMPDKEDFRRNYNDAVRNGWLKPPGG